jgi:hypothetical protein
VPTPRSAKTTANLRLRTAPGTQYETLSILPSGFSLTVYDELKYTDPALAWAYAVTSRGNGWVAQQYLTSGGPPPPPPPPPTGRRWGAHIHQGSPNEGAVKNELRAIARAGKMKGFVAINDWIFASELLSYPGVEYGVLRKVAGPYDPGPDYAGDSADFGRGYRFFTNKFHWEEMYANADPGLILQYNNENNLSHDGEFFRGLMTAASEKGRKVVIFNDSVGATELFFDAQGRPQSPQWARRREAMIMAIELGHFVGMHTYGQIDAFFHPVSASDSPGAWPWYGGRFEQLYASMPDVQPPLLLNEKGPGKSELQRAMGFEVYWADHVAFEAKVAHLPYLKCYMDWTTGGQGPYGFEGDSLDDWLPLIAARL